MHARDPSTWVKPYSKWEASLGYMGLSEMGVGLRSGGKQAEQDSTLAWRVGDKAVWRFSQKHRAVL